MVLQLDSITKKYGEVYALNNINLTFVPGVYALLGPNGAGKSTLINILTNNLKPDSGKVLFEGKEIQDCLNEYLSVIGYIPQTQSMYKDFRVSFFLGYMAALKGIHKNDINQEVETVLRKVDLSDYKNRRISTLSGGMKQRLLIAQGLLGNPHIIILDEPTTGLDPEQRIEFKKLISEEAENRIILIATHIVSDIEYITNKIILIKNGQILAFDDRETLLSTISSCVYEADLNNKEFEFIKTHYNIIEFMHNNDRVHVRFFANALPQNINCITSAPNLNDVFFSLYRE